MSKPLIYISLIIIIILSTATGGCIGATSNDEEVSLILVPVEIRGANNLGSIYGELVFDSDALFPVDIKKGSIAHDALLEYSTNVRGRIIFGLIEDQGISDDGQMIIVRFQALDENATTLLELQNVTIHNTITMNQVNTIVTEGSYNHKGPSMQPPIITVVP